MKSMCVAVLAAVPAAMGQICPPAPLVSREFQQWFQSDRYLVQLGGRTLRLIDFGNEGSPVELPAVALPEAVGLAVRGTSSYFAVGNSNDSTIRLIDLSDPTHPQFSERFPVPNISDLKFDRTRMAGTWSSQAFVVDLTWPGRPRVVRHPELVGKVVLVHGSLMMLTDETTRMYDISDVDHPQYLGDFPVRVWSCTHIGDSLCVYSESNSETQVWDLSERPPRLASTLPGGLWTTEASDSAFTVAGEHPPILTQFEVTDPAHPRQISRRAAGVSPIMGFENGTVLGNGSAIAEQEWTPPSVQVGAWVNTSVAAGIDLVGDRLYVTRGQLGVQIYDVSDTNQPVLIGSAAINSATGVAATAGGIAYVAARTSVGILDCTDPASPQIIGSIPGGSNVTHLALYGATLAVMDRNLGVKLYDVSIPNAPVLLSNPYTQTAAGIALDDRTLWVSSPANRSAAFEISDPRQPLPLGDYGTSNAVGIIDDFVHLTRSAAATECRWRATGRPASWRSLPQATVVAARNGAVWTGSTTAIVASVSAGDSLWRIGSFVSTVGPYGIATNGRVAAVSYSTGFRLAEMTEFTPRPPITTPFLHESSTTTGDARGAAVLGSRAIVAHADGLALYDCSPGANLRWVSSWAAPKGITGLFSVNASGVGAFIAGEHGVYAARLSGDRVDYSDPVRAGMCWRTATGARFAAAYCEDETASGVRLFDFEDPAVPTLGAMLAGVVPTSFAASGDVLYVLHGDRFKIFDCSDVRAPVQLADIQIPVDWSGISSDGERLTIDGGFAYLSRGRLGIEILDISDPANPTSVANIPEIVTSLFKVGTNLYIQQSGLVDSRVWDVSNPRNPALAPFPVAMDHVHNPRVSGAGPHGMVIASHVRENGFSEYGVVMSVLGGPVAASITRQPESVESCPGSPARFTIGAVGTGYQWRHDGVPISGALGPELVIDRVHASTLGRYDCIVFGCENVTSAPAFLSACLADMNCDGFLDFFDYGDFTAAFEDGSPIADFNGDAFIDFFDYADFVLAFETGC